MYISYFGCREKPFNVTPDPRFFFQNAVYRESYANLLAGIRERKGFIVMTGEVGTGKTTLLRLLMRNLEANVRFVYFYNTTLSFEELLTYICEEFGLETPPGRLKKIQALNEFLIEQLRTGGTAALLIDEAQHLSEHVLENLRLLSNLETSTEKLLQIVLVGQPELETKLAQPSLRQLKQRVALQCRVDRLKDREVKPYIQFRLESVGCEQKDLFHSRAIERIIRYSTGIPRLINIICDNALTIAYATSARQVSGEMIDEVASDLQLTDQPETSPAPRPEPEAPAPAPPAARPSAAATPLPTEAAPRPAARPASPPVTAAPVPAPPAAVPTFARAKPAAERRRLPQPRRRAVWPAIAAVVAAGVVGAGVWQADQVITRAATLRDAVRSGSQAVGAAAVLVWGGVRERLAPAARPVSAAPEPSAAPAPESRPVGPDVASAAPTHAEVAPAPVPAVPRPAVPDVSRASSRDAERRATLPPAPAAAKVAAVRPEPAPAPRVPDTRGTSGSKQEAAPTTSARKAETEPRAAEGPVTELVPGKRPVLVPQGGTVSNLAYQAYGRYNTLAIDLIKEANPHIQDLDWIRSGEQIWLPPLNAETLVRSQGDGSYRIVLASFLSQAAADKLGELIRRRGFEPTITPRQVTRQLALYRVEIAGVPSRSAAEQAWSAAVTNCWVFIHDTPCEGKSHE